MGRMQYKCRGMGNLVLAATDCVRCAACDAFLELLDIDADVDGAPSLRYYKMHDVCRAVRLHTL